MQENFLHFIWQLQYFNRQQLHTHRGEPVNIIFPGRHNEHAGPDFTDSRIYIDDILWNGQVEIHLNSSDWYRHRHQMDDAYQNVILHVVWHHDQPVWRKDQTEIPTLELKDRIDPEFYARYAYLIQNTQHIPCAEIIKKVKPVTLLSMQESALMQRLERKSEGVLDLLSHNRGDWEETTYQLVSKILGNKVNADPFLTLSQSLPFKIISKNRNSLLQLESLLFGQAGFLRMNGKDPYFHQLSKEFQYLHHKYSLPQPMELMQWKFLRLRPANFPTIRLAQLARFLHQQRSMFSPVKSNTDLEELLKLFRLTQSVYWQEHYQFGKKFRTPVKGMGELTIYNLLINAVIPIWAAYGRYIDDVTYIQRAVSLLQMIPAEKNKITRSWNSLGLKVKSAFDSQSLLELFNEYCSFKQCLSCKIGGEILQDRHSQFRDVCIPYYTKN